MKQHNSSFKISDQVKKDNESVYIASGIPTRKLERWKYTDLSKLIKGNDNFVMSPAQIELSDSHFVRDFNENDEVLFCNAPKYGKNNDMQLWNLNILNINNGLVVDIPPNTIIENVLDLKILGLDNSHHHTRIIINIGKNSSLKMIEHQLSNGQCWKNTIFQVFIDDGAEFDHLIINNESKPSVSTALYHVKASKDARYRAFVLNNGAKLVRNQFHVDIDGAGVDVSVRSINKLSSTDFADLTILMNHKAANSNSSQLVRSVLDDSSKFVFQGKSVVAKGASQSNAEQVSRSIQLSNLAEIINKPELEIYNDDVKCAHGATTGSLDENQLFYMMSRGISEKDAKSLLIDAFILDVYKDEIEPFREAIECSLYREVLNA